MFSNTCPHCGYCQHCGRGGYKESIYPRYYDTTVTTSIPSPSERELEKRLKEERATDRCNHQKVSY